MEIKDSVLQVLDTDHYSDHGRIVALRFAITALIKAHSNKTELKEAFEETMEDAHHWISAISGMNSKISEEQALKASKAFHDETDFLRDQIW